MLLPGESVMADRGFLVEEEVAVRGRKLFIPAFLSVGVHSLRQLRSRRLGGLHERGFTLSEQYNESKCWLS